MSTVYGLYSNRNNIVKYVGQTDDINARFKGHLREALKKNGSTPKCQWIREEIAAGFEVNYIILMQDCKGELNERRILDAYLLSGHELVNTMHMPSQRERQREGILAARKRGVHFGRKPTSQEQINLVLQMRADGHTIRKICKAARVSPTTVGKIINVGLNNVEEA